MKDKRKWVLAAVLAAVMLAAGPGVLAHAAAAAVLEAGTDANTLSEEGNAQGQKEDGPGEKPVPEAAWADDKTGLENQQPDAAETEPVQTQPAGLESSPAQIMPEQENSQMQGDSSVSDSQTDSSVGGGIPLADGSGGAAQKDVAEVTVDGGGTYRVNELKDAFKPQGGAVKITLLEDVQLQYVEYMIEIDNGGTYTLDLNNHIISGETTYTGWSIFLIRNGCLVLQDSGDKDRGCIQSNKYANAVSVEENGSFIFYSGKIDGFSQGVMVWSGKAEITGKSHIRTNGFGLVFVSGEIFISGEAEIYGSNCGVSSARGGEKVSGTITIDGNPYICGGGYGLVVDFYWYMVTPDYHVNISGGTFECETADEGEQRAVYIDTGMNVPVISWLKNYGTDRTPNYTFYNCDDKSPATNIFYNDSAYGKVYVDICYHKDGWSYYSQIPNTTTHLEMCLYCGNSKKADCTYIWKKDGMVYTGPCRCGSEIKVMLSGKGEYLYNGTEHKPEASVELNYVKLNPDEYTITYMDNRNAGTAKAIVSGRNGYQFQCNAEFAVRKSIISPKEGKLDAENGKRKEYRFDLKQLLPELPRGQEFGSSPAVYRLGDVSLPGSYYAGEARVEGSTLILPLNLAGNHTEGIIGTVKITIVSQNFQDMEGIVTVIAGKAGNGDTDSGDTDTNPDGSDNNSGNENPKPNPVFPDTSPSGSGSTADSGTNPSDSGSTAKNENEPGNSSAAGNENEPDKSAGDAHTVTSVKLSKTVFTYTGKAKKPSVIAINKEGKRISARYYTITYKNNKKAGIAAAAVKFRGTYKSAGTVKLAFTIRPAKPSIQKITGVSGGILVKWKKAAQAGGYQIQYSENADFQGSSTHSVFAESPSVTQKTLGKRKDGTGYYVRIRAYRTARSESRQTKIYSAWSTPVRIRGK